MHNETVYLDLTKDHDATNRVHLRRGESGLTTIEGVITNGAIPYDLTGTSVLFKALDAQKRYVIAQAKVTDAKGGKVSYVVDSKLTSIEGNVNVAYFEISTGDKNITTPAIPIIVLKNVDLTGVQADEYESEISALLKLVEDMMADAGKATTDANAAAQAANSAASSATTAAASANASSQSASTQADRAKAAADQAEAAYPKANAAADAANAAAAAANPAAQAANKAADAANAAASRTESAVNAANQALTKANDAANRTIEAVEEAWAAAGDAHSAADATRAATKRINETMETFDTVTGVENAYAAVEDPNDFEDAAWTASPQAVPQGMYQVVRRTTHYLKRSDDVTYSIAYEGKDGEDAVVTEANNLYMFQVRDDGHLYLGYEDAYDAPNAKLENGHLYIGFETED